MQCFINPFDTPGIISHRGKCALTIRAKILPLVITLFVSMQFKPEAPPLISENCRKRVARLFFDKLALGSYATRVGQCLCHKAGMPIKPDEVPLYGETVERNWFCHYALIHVLVIVFLPMLCL